MDQLKNNPDSALSSPRPPPPLRNLPLEGYRILLVEDCLENQFLFKQILARKGADVTLAGDGAQGSQLALAGEFDLVLMDIEMPVMGGYEAMSILNTAEYTKPVFAITGHARSEEIQKILASGFAAHIAKPLDKEHLIQMIQGCSVK